MNKLSKENYDELNENYLYQNEPDESNHVNYIGGTYWCRNWTFKVRKHDGEAYMYDTYFDNWDSAIKVTDENIDDFKFVFDFREVSGISDSTIDEYNEEDLYRVATNSGGYSCGHLYWVKKDTQKSKQLLIDKKKREIRSLKNNLKWAEDELERLLNEE